MPLDRDREIEHLRGRLASATVQAEPFPHVRIENILSTDLYLALDAAWPVVESVGKRHDLEPGDGLDPAIVAPWDFFISVISRPLLGPWLRRAFAPSVNQRLARLEDWHRAGQTPLDRPWYHPPYDPQMNRGRLMWRRRGFTLRPHVDAPAYLVTALLYFPDSLLPVEDFGTTLYQVDRPLSDEELVRFRTIYFEDAGIGCRPAASVPFRSNTLLAFPNTATSAHGLEVTTASWRRAYQAHLSLKPEQSGL